MRLSVVVPAFNEERLIAGTLHHLKAGMEALERHGCSSELIVCDNNSTDRTAQIARAASGDWLLFVDADSSPAPALFEEVLAAIESGKASAAAARSLCRGRRRRCAPGSGYGMC